MKKEENKEKAGKKSEESEKDISRIKTEKGIFISKPSLLSIGCRNCVHKLNNQCFKGLVGDESVPEGYCDDLVNWLLSLAGDSNSDAILWERYNTFVAQLQANEDYAEYKKLDGEIKSLILQREDHNGLESLEKLEMKRLTAKIWWHRINETLLKALGKANDRESRNENTDKIVAGISLTQIHSIANETRRQLELKNND